MPKRTTAALLAASYALSLATACPTAADISAAGDIDPVYPGADPWNTTDLYVGQNGVGTLDIFNAGVVNSAAGFLGYEVGSTGTVTLDGIGTEWNLTDRLLIGSEGVGTLSILNGAVVTTGDRGDIGYYETGAASSATVDGAGSLWSLAGNLGIGGTLTIQNGGSVESLSGGISSESNLTSSALITGAGSQWISQVSIGVNDNAKLEILDGGVVTAGGAARFSGNASYTSEVVVSGPGSVLTIGDELDVGSSGPATLTISNGGVLINNSDEDSYLGYGTNGDGLLTVDGAGSRLDNGGDLFIGRIGTGVISIQNGGVLNNEGTLWTDADSTANGTIQFNNGTLNAGTLIAHPSTLQGIGTINANGVIADYDVVFDQPSSPIGQATINALPGQNIALTVEAAPGSVSTLMGAGYRSSGSLTVEAGAQITSGEGIIGYEPGSNGTVTVTGIGSRWDIEGQLNVGRRGTGTLHILAGGIVTNDYYGGFIGNNAGSTGAVIVDGLGSHWDNRSGLTVGSSGSGTMEIRNGGRVSSNSGKVNGPTTVDGLGSQWDIAGDLYISNTTGILSIVNGGSVTVEGIADIATNTGSIAALKVSGPGSHLIVQDILYAGRLGDGTLTIDNGGRVISRSHTDIVRVSSATGTVTVDGAGSRWDSGTEDDDELTIGRHGPGTLIIQNGGEVNHTGIIWTERFDTSDGTIQLNNGTLNTFGLYASLEALQGTGTINTNAVIADFDLVFQSPNNSPAQALLNTVPGQNITVNVTAGNASDSLFLGAGYSGTGTMTIEGGTGVYSYRGMVGEKAGSDGTVTIIGSGSKWDIQTGLSLAEYGTGNLNILDGAAVNNQGTTIAYDDNSTGTATVSGPGSSWGMSGRVSVGFQGTGTLNILNGGVVTVSEYGRIGDFDDAVGIVTVDGAGSQWTIGEDLFVGDDGTGTLNIQNAGVVNTNDIAYIGRRPGSTGTANIAGINSKWSIDDTLYVGREGDGTLTINSGGLVESKDGAFLGYEDNTIGTVAVAGAGSHWDISNDPLYLGDHGIGTLTIQNGGAVTSALDVYVGNRVDSIGIANVGGIGSQWNNLDTLYIGHSGGGTLLIENSGLVTTFDNAYLGYNTGSTGAATVDGVGSRWDVNRDLHVGRDGTGVLTIQNGGVVNTQFETLVGSGSGTGTIQFSNGTLNTTALDAAPDTLLGTGTINTKSIIADRDLVFGQPNGTQVQFVLNGLPGQSITFNVDASQAINRNDIGAGDMGTGSLTVQDGVQIASYDGTIGNHAGSNGTATITGPGSMWAIDNNLQIGRNGTGTLNILGGASVTNGSGGNIGYNAGSDGTVTVDGAGSQWTTRSLYVGRDGTGTLTIQNGGVVNAESNTRLRYFSGTGAIHFNNGTLNTGELLAPGESLTGTGTINTNGIVSDIDLVFNQASGLQQQATLSALPGQNITVNVDASDTSAYNFGAGYAGVGSLTIEGGVQIASINGYLGYHAGSAGSATVTGGGSRWDQGSRMYVGRDGAGTLNILNGGKVSTGFQSYIGYNTGSVGTATIDGLGSRWIQGNDFFVGHDGDATLGIQNAGEINSATGYIGKNAGSTGTATVAGSGSRWSLAGDLWVGDAGEGTLTIQNGGAVTTTHDAYIGDLASATGTVHVSGAGARWDLTDRFSNLYIGDAGTGALTIDNGGQVTSVDNAYIGYEPGSTGTVTISGAGSRWSNSDLIVVGAEGAGTLEIQDRGVLIAPSISLGASSGSTGVFNVDGNGSIWRHSGGITIGNNGAGALNITNGGSVYGASNDGRSTVPSARIASRTNSTGSVVVDGAGSEWTITGSVDIGERAAGELTISGGAVMTSATEVSQGGGVPFARIGTLSEGTGIVTVDGPGSQWNNDRDLFVGYYGTGTLNIRNGGVVESWGVTQIGYNPSATGTIHFDNGTLTTGGLLASANDLLGTGTINTNSLVSDGDMLFTPASGLQQQIIYDVLPGQNITINFDFNQPPTVNTRDFIGAGYGGLGSMTIEGGAVINNQDGYIGYEPGSDGTVEVTGAGSRWGHTYLDVGRKGTGTLSINNQGQANSYKAYIGRNVGSTGTATIDGIGSSWTVNDRLYVGDYGTGTLNIQNGGVVISDYVTDIAYSTSTGTVNVDGAGSLLTSEYLSVGRVGVGELNILNGGGVINAFLSNIGDLEGSVGTATVDGAGSRWDTGTVLRVGDEGTGTLNIQNQGLVNAGGNIIINSNSAINLAGGTLDVNGGILSVAAGGQLNFNAGTLADASQINLSGSLMQTGGTLAPGDSPGTTTINGDYILLAGDIAIELGGTLPGGGHDKVLVNGSLVLGPASTLDIKLINAFSPADGHSFDVLDFTSLTGTFGTLSLPTLTGELEWDTSSLYTDGKLRVAFANPGDFDGDGDVDGVDLAVMFTNFNGPGGGAPSNPQTDMDGDDDVDGVDLASLFALFTGPLSPANVPEPSSMVLIGLAGLLLTRRR